MRIWCDCNIKRLTNSTNSTDFISFFFTIDNWRTQTENWLAQSTANDGKKWHTTEMHISFCVALDFHPTYYWKCTRTPYVCVCVCVCELGFYAIHGKGIPFHDHYSPLNYYPFYDLYRIYVHSKCTISFFSVDLSVSLFPFIFSIPNLLFTEWPVFASVSLTLIISSILNEGIANTLIHTKRSSLNHQAELLLIVFNKTSKHQQMTKCIFMISALLHSSSSLPSSTFLHNENFIRHHCTL